MLYLTAADAAIGCWDDKARWLFWRPITAIHQADVDRNPATEADPGWLPPSTRCRSRASSATAQSN